jgi:hypothetical protein
MHSPVIVIDFAQLQLDLLWLQLVRVMLQLGGVVAIRLYLTATGHICCN